MRPQFLDAFRRAGIEWLAIGVEATNPEIRRKVLKGSFEETNVRDVVRAICDAAWHAYFTNPAYLALVESRFGAGQRRNVEAMAQHRLKRRLLGD